jgi:hypothetical protein
MPGHHRLLLQLPDQRRHRAQAAHWNWITGTGYAAATTPTATTCTAWRSASTRSSAGLRIGQRLYDERKKLAQSWALKGIIYGGRLPTLAAARHALRQRRGLCRANQGRPREGPGADLPAAQRLQGHRPDAGLLARGQPVQGLRRASALAQSAGPGRGRRGARQALRRTADRHGAGGNGAVPAAARDLVRRVSGHGALLRRCHRRLSRGLLRLPGAVLVATAVHGRQGAVAGAGHRGPDPLYRAAQDALRDMACATTSTSSAARTRP